MLKSQADGVVRVKGNCLAFVCVLAMLQAVLLGLCEGDVYAFAIADAVAVASLAVSGSYRQANQKNSNNSW